MSDTARVDELLVQQAIEGLTDAESAELEGLLAACPDRNRTSVERAAAAVWLAAARPSRSMPPALRQRIEAALRGEAD